MRLCHRAGHVVPMLTITAVLAGCATSTTDQPPNFTANPQVVAIYAVDSAFGSLPDELIFSTDPADTGKISTSPPPSYGSYRVEFDQPINGITVANNANRGTGPTPGGVASFCSPLATNPIQLVDIQGDATRAAGPVTSSVCYDATSPLGSHPHVLIIPGRNALNDAAAPALTCNTFRADPGLGDGGNVFKSKHKYGIKVNAATIQNGAGKPLSAPTGVGWAGDTFQFTTSGQRILAAGFQDGNTGFFVWLQKPEPGFEKDLAPCATTSTCPDVNGNNILATFEKPADSSPFFVVLTEPITDPADVALAGAADLSADVTLVRADDNSNPDTTSITGLPPALGGLLGDPRVIEIFPGDTYEPGQAYKVTVPGTIKADTGDVLENPTTYTFTAQPGTPSRLSTIPGNGAQAQGHATVPVPVVYDDGSTPTVLKTLNVNATAATTPLVEFSSPVLDDGAGTPSGTFTLKTAAGAAVASTAAVLDGTNHQLVAVVPTAPLVPETTYQVSWTGVKTALVPKIFANQAFPDGSSQFTTATFRMAILDDPKLDTATSSTNVQRNGFARRGVTVVVVNLDRRTDVEPADMKGGNLRVIFNNSAAGVDTSSLVLSELSGTANQVTAISGFTVDPTTAGSTTNFTIKLPAAYQLKYGQKYEVRAKPAITNPTSGKALKAEGCNVADCSDVKSFTTRKVGAAIAPDPASTAATGFRVNFTDPIDPASLTPFLATEFKLFARDPATGALNPTPVPITCTITSPTRVTCRANAPLAPNGAYLASAVFLQTATQGQGGPAKVDPTVSTDASAQFFGSVTGNIFGPCP